MGAVRRRVPPTHARRGTGSWGAREVVMLDEILLRRPCYAKAYFGAERRLPRL
jgi:hypothetical protein